MNYKQKVRKCDELINKADALFLGIKPYLEQTEKELADEERKKILGTIEEFGVLHAQLLDLNVDKPRKQRMNMTKNRYDFIKESVTKNNVIPSAEDSSPEFNSKLDKIRKTMLHTDKYFEGDSEHVKGEDIPAFKKDLEEINKLIDSAYEFVSTSREIKILDASKSSICAAKTDIAKEKQTAAQETVANAEVEKLSTLTEGNSYFAKAVKYIVQGEHDDGITAAEMKELVQFFVAPKVKFKG